MMRKHVWKLLCHQRDILSPQAIGGVTLAMNELQTAISEGANKGKIRIKMEELEFAANKWFKPYPNAMWRENVEVLLVALAVAMGIRTFFVQPFKIPTGSMQPTLYGVTSTPNFTKIDFSMEDKSKLQAAVNEELKARASLVFPTGWERIRDWFEGYTYIHVVANEDGRLEAIGKPVRFLILNIKQTLLFNGKPITIWFPPDYGEVPLPYRAGLEQNEFFRKGQDIIKMRVQSGDHLFVDRLTYNFRPPERGETIVFDTHGIDQLPISQQDTFYIKRLVGLGGETLAIKQDYEITDVPRFGTVPVGHLVIDGKPLSASTPHFGNLYGFVKVARGQKTIRYQENQYYGHAMLEGLAPGESFHVQPRHYFVMGDNTMNSSDSRYWGDFPENKVIGKAFFVYWPITSRFGLDNR